MKMNYKKYNYLIIKTLLIIFAAIITINYVINPFGVFNLPDLKINRHKSELKRQERLTKIMQLKSAKHIDAIVLGSSREDFSINENYFNQLTSKKMLNLAMQGARFNEQKYIIEKALNLHPEIKTIVLGIDFDFYYLQDNSSKELLKNYENSTFQNYITILLSFDAIESSITTIAKSLNPNYTRGFSSCGTKNIFINDEIDTTFEKTIHQYRTTGQDFINNKPNLEELKNLIKELHNKDVNVILYMHPVHCVMLEIIKQNGAENCILEFKKELAKIQPFYDYYYPSEYTEEKINPNMHYFFESSHCTYLVGNKILETIFTANNNSFGYLITENNVYQYHKLFKKDLSKWEKKNPIWVKKIKDIRKES